MKGDFTRDSFDERKQYSQVLLQQGRVQLDADWNEAAAIAAHRDERALRDLIGASGSPDEGFQIAARRTLDPLESADGWTKAEDVAKLCVDYIDRLRGNASLRVTGASGIVKSLSAALDLSGSNVSLVFAVKSAKPPLLDNGILPQCTGFTFFVADQADKKASWVVATLTPVTVGLWQIYSCPLTVATKDPGFQSNNVQKIGFAQLKTNWTYHFDLIQRSFAPPSLPLQDILALDSLEQINGWSIPAPGTVALDGNQPFQQRPTVRITGPGDGFKSFGEARNLRSYARIITVTSQGSDPKFFLKTQAGAKIKLQNITSTTSAGWSTHVGDIPTTADLSQIVGYGLEGLAAGTSRNVAQVLGVLNLAGNFIIHPGRLYVDGIACSKDHIEPIETYYSQKAYPEALPLEPADNRIDLVYTDVFQRHITAIEDPELREVALGGPDTCTRVQTVAQVKVLKGSVDASTGRLDCATLPAGLKKQFDQLLAAGQGTLSTLVTAPGPADNLCEIAADSDYLGLDNRLYRVEIHDAGPVGKARFKWSKNNGAMAVAMVEDAAPATGSNPQQVRLERLGRDRATYFSVGDWVEISDDLTELADAYGADGLPVRRVGELRQVKEVDPDANTITLDSALAHSYTIARHAKVRQWDGVGLTAVFVDTAHTPQLDFGDGVQITFDGGTRLMLSGDYWQFTARGITGQIEKLDHAPPAGVVHHFCPLALIKWRRNASGVFEIVDVADCRKHFPALTDIQATDVAYDDGCCGLSEDVQILAKSHGDKVEGKVANVQQALDVLCAREREYLTLRYVGGDGQHGLPDTELGMELVVAVENVLGEPQKDVQVNFKVQEGAGSLSPPSPPAWKTDDNGEVRVRWTLGPDKGLNQVRASLDTPQAGTPEIIFNALGVAAQAGGGLCTITVGDGVNSHGQFNGYEGLVEALDKAAQDNSGFGTMICILRGSYRLEQPIRRSGMGNLILKGNGINSTVLECEDFMPLRFDNCSDIELRNLSIILSGNSVSEESLAGVVHFAGCTAVVMENCDIRADNAATTPVACMLIEGPETEMRAIVRRNSFSAMQSGENKEIPRVSGIVLRSAYVAEITDNFLFIDGRNGGGFGIDLEDNSFGCVIANNTVVGVPPDPQTHIGSLGGIHVGSFCDGVIVRENRILHGMGLGIALGSVDSASLASKGSVSNLTIEGNEIRNMASGGIGLVSFTVSEMHTLSPITDGLLIRSNHIENCAYGEGHVCHGDKGDFRLGGAIVLWMGAEMRLLDNQLLYNGRTGGLVHAPHPVSGILAFYPGPGLLISRNLIRENFSWITTDPGLFAQPAAGISLYSPQSGGGDQPDITITDNQIDNPGGAALYSRDALKPITIRVSGNYLFGTNQERNDGTDKEGAIFISDHGLEGSFISDHGLEGSVLQFDNNYVVTGATNPNPKPNVNFFSMSEGTIQIHNNHVVTWLDTPNVEVVNRFEAQHVTINANHFVCRENLPQKAHLQVECDYISTGLGSSNVSMNHCLESALSLSKAPSISIKVHGMYGKIMAVANVTTNGVRLDSPTPSTDLANIMGVFV